MKKVTVLALLLSLSGLALGQEAPPPDAEVRRLIEEFDPNLKQINAAKALAALGPRAAPAVPSLVYVLQTTKDPRLLRAVVDTLGAIGPQARPALEQLRRVAQLRLLHIQDMYRITGAGLEELPQAAKKAIQAIEGPPIRLSPQEVDPANEGKTVTLEGVLEGKQELRDAQFGVRTEQPRLRRVLEHYQWVEERQRLKGQTSKKKTVYRYTKRWDSRLHHSHEFKVTKGHENPWRPGLEPAIAKLDLESGLRIGKFEIEDSLVETGEFLPFELPAKTGKVSWAVFAGTPLVEWTPSGDAFYAAPADPKEPKVGDHRVRFMTSNPAPVTVQGVQRGSAIHRHP